MRLLKYARRHIVYPGYRVYAELKSRLIREGNLPPIPCQICGDYHHERYCPKVREYGFLDKPKSS